MSDDSSTPWVARYRASAVDPQTPALDQAIIEAARDHLARRSSARHVLAASGLGAVVILAFSMNWKGHEPAALPRSGSDYGKVEGISRRYLMEFQSHQFTGYGLTERDP